MHIECNTQLLNYTRII